MGSTTQSALVASGQPEGDDDKAAERRGIDIGLCLAAAILVRDFDSDTYALEILGAGGIDAARIAEIDLDPYDAEPLLEVLPRERSEREKSPFVETRGRSAAAAGTVTEAENDVI